VALGGRPQNAPMQGVGGVKGSSIEHFDFLVGQVVSIMNETSPSAFASVSHEHFLQLPGKNSPGAEASEYCVQLTTIFLLAQW